MLQNVFFWFWCSFSSNSGYCYLQIVLFLLLLGSLKLLEYLFLGSQKELISCEIMKFLLEFFFVKTHRLHWLLRGGGKLFVLRGRGLRSQEITKYACFESWIKSEGQVWVALLDFVWNLCLIGRKFAAGFPLLMILPKLLSQLRGT